MKLSNSAAKVRAHLAGFALLALSLAGCGDSGPDSAGAPPTFRRLTQEQYGTVIADIFGADIKVQGRFDPDVREEGLLAIGTGRVSVTPASLEQYDSLAYSIAAQVVDENHRDLLIGCRPSSKTTPDDVCARQFLGEVGAQLYRRPLRAAELEAQAKVASDAAAKSGDFYYGLGVSLAVMLESPRFLFREEIAEPDPDHAGALRLDAYSKASRLSFFLWNAAPDSELLSAAATGELDTARGRARQVDRMLESPRLKVGVRAFFTDMLAFDTLSNLAKDPAIYPKFTPTLPAEAQEQTLRTITDHLITRKGDYRDLFTTRRTFLTPLLASIYQVPVQPRKRWEPYEFPDGDMHEGIVTEISFLALHSHPGRSSPTLRGKAVREILLCQTVPTPPANVNFALVQDTKNVNLRTARDRLTAHRTEPTCAGCHKIIDPIGLSLETFDGVGEGRLQENGTQIDVSGQLDAAQFTGATGLAKTLHDAPAVTACLVSRLYGYAAGHSPNKGEAEWLKYLQESFAADGYRLPDLMRRIAIGDAFYRVSTPSQTTTTQADWNVNQKAAEERKS